MEPASQALPWGKFCLEWFKHIKRKPAEISVLIVLMARRDDEGYAWLPTKQFMELTGYDERQLFRAFDTLEQLGWIKRITLDGRHQFQVHPPVTTEFIAKYTPIYDSNTDTHDTRTDAHDSFTAAQVAHPDDHDFPSDACDACVAINSTKTDAHDTNSGTYDASRVPLSTTPHDDTQQSISTVVQDDNELHPRGTLAKPGKGSAILLSMHLTKQLGLSLYAFFTPSELAPLERMLLTYGSYETVRDILDEAMLAENRKQILLESKRKRINPAVIEAWALRNKRIASKESDTVP